MAGAPRGPSESWSPRASSWSAFVVNEMRVAQPLFPLTLLRIRGIAAADLIQLAAFGGFTGSFFFLTLYMQNVLGFSPIQGGSAYLPVTAVIMVTAGICSVLIGRTGTRPIIVVSALVASGGMFLLSRIPVDGTYTSDLLPGLLVMGVGRRGPAGDRHQRRQRWRPAGRRPDSPPGCSTPHSRSGPPWPSQCSRPWPPAGPTTCSRPAARHPSADSRLLPGRARRRDLRGRRRADRPVRPQHPHGHHHARGRGR